MFSVLILTVVLGFGALLVDLGQRRTSTRWEQLAADLAAVAAGKAMSENDPNTACQDAIKYLNTNDKAITTAINPVTFCAPITNSCSLATAERAPATTVGTVTVSIHHPVPDSEIQSAYWSGAGKNDGLPCSRMRVLVTHVDSNTLGRVFGSSGGSTTRSATVRPYPSDGRPPALWLLDPHGCSTPLKVDGGSQVTVGTSTVQGVITIDSDGTDSHCTTSQTTIDVSGSGSFVKAIGPPSGGTTGQINLVALPSGATSCTGSVACQDAEVSSGLLGPQPQHGSPATRAYVDWKYNCKKGYPIYHGVAVQDCSQTVADGGTSYAYVDLLRDAVGTNGVPSGFTEIKDQGNDKPCSTGDIVYPPGNWYVNCPKGNNGYVLNGRTVTFQGGNIVFADSVTVSNNGVLNINTANTNATLDPSCMPPTVSTPCMVGKAWNVASSTKAAIVAFRGDSSTVFSSSGGGVVNLNSVFVYGGTGAIAFSGAPPTWTAPAEGPFMNLAYWTDMPATASTAQLSSFTITGGSGASLTGVFFTPEAQPFKLAGGGNWGQQRAQFVSYDLTVTGGGILQMAPDPAYPAPPSRKGYLIR